MIILDHLTIIYQPLQTGLIFCWLGGAVILTEQFSYKSPQPPDTGKCPHNNVISGFDWWNWRGFVAEVNEKMWRMQEVERLQK